MQRLLMAGVLTGLMAASAPIDLEVNGNQESVLPTLRYDLYLNRSHGIRFIYPEGYRVDSATAYHSPASGEALQLSLEIWKEQDYIPFGGRYQDEPAGAESPPHISVEVFQNPEGRPLQDWMELATSPGQVITVAGQGAIAYTATGLYEYDVVLLNSAEGEVVKLQVGFMDVTDPMREAFQTIVSSLTFDTTSETGAVDSIDYSRLQASLMAEDWQGADLETRAILMRLVSGYDYLYPGIESDDIETLPCEDLQILDALWSQHSEGQFGFRAQHQLWQSLTLIDSTARAEQLGQQLGWRRNGPRLDIPFGDSLWRSDTEITYAVAAPVGHLPWPGVASLTIERMLQESGAGCGSCTIDAMYISRDRFPDYLNSFMARVDECLCNQASEVTR